MKNLTLPSSWNDFIRKSAPHFTGILLLLTGFFLFSSAVFAGDSSLNSAKVSVKDSAKVSANRAASEAENRLEPAAVFSLSISEEGAAQWQNPDPESLEITYVPEGGSRGQGILRFRILKPLSGRLEVRGPSFEVPECSTSAIRRTVPLAVRAKLLNMTDAAAAVSLLWPNGRRVSSVAGNRDFETALLMTGTQYADWTSFTKNAGCVLPGCNSHKVQLMLDFTAKSAPCEFLLESLAFTQEVKIAHRITSESVGNVFFSEKGEVRILWADAVGLKSGKVTVSDEEGRKIAEITAAAGEKETVIPLKERGFYALSACGEYENGRILTTDSTAAVVGPEIPETVREHSRFGLMRCHMSEDFAVKLGSRWDSGWYDFSAVQQNPDGTLYSKFTDEKDTKDEKNAENTEESRNKTQNPSLNPSLNASPNPPKRRLKQISSSSGNYPLWLRRPDVPNQGLYPPKDWEKLGECVELWTRTNPSLPDVLGPYHEVDGAWKTSSEDLVKFHNVVSAAYKRARPDIPVAGPVFCNISLPYFEDLVKKGILKDNDAVNIHPYVNGSAPEDEFITEIIEMQDFLKEQGLGTLPVYFTEFGWTCSENDWQKPVSSLTRARYCARSLVLCTARNIRALVYFAGRFQEPEDIEHYWMVRSNYTPYATMAAYAAAVRELSAIPEGGNFYRLAPNIFLCTFLREGKSLWVLWTADGTDREITLPEMPLTIRSMTGKPLKPSVTLSLTPSPVYIEFENPSLSTVFTAESAEVFPGESVPADGEPLLAVTDAQARSLTCFTEIPGEKSDSDKKGLSGENGASGEKGTPNKKKNVSVCFPENVSVGPYTVLQRSADGTILAQPVSVVTPLEITWKDFEWNGKSDTLALRFTVRNHLNSAASGIAEVKTEVQAEKNTKVKANNNAEKNTGKNSGKTSAETHISVPFTVSQGEETIVSLSVPVQTGVRMTGNVLFQTRAPIHRETAVSYDVTPTAIPYYSDSEEDVNWEAIQGIPVNRWARPGDVREREQTDTPVEMKFYANRKGLRILLTVRDPQHRQRYGSWSFMNSEDSLRLGFDFDAGKLWEFNNIRFGYNGHRCVEYAISRTQPDSKTGEAQNQWWTVRSWLETIKNGPAFNLIPGTKIVRDDEKELTTYDLSFTWKDLGSEEPLPVGGTLGFSLVVYDKNDEAILKIVRFGKGAADGTPLEYGRVILAEP